VRLLLVTKLPNYVIVIPAKAGTHG
jgi:hypothetical protein